MAICPRKGCGVEINPYIIMESYDQEIINKMEKITEEKKAEVFICPNCGNTLVENANFSKNEFCCVVCGEIVCQLCMKKSKTEPCNANRAEVRFNAKIVYKIT